MRRDNKTGITGVCCIERNPKTPRCRPYRAYYFQNKKRVIVGLFKTCEDAKVALAAARASTNSQTN